jgi:hypothetical protein
LLVLIFVYRKVCSFSRRSVLIDSSSLGLSLPSLSVLDRLALLLTAEDFDRFKGGLFKEVGATAGSGEMF